MADFCQQCSLSLFNRDYHDLANLGDPSTLSSGEGWGALCEECGPTVVDNYGKCIADNCPIHGIPSAYLSPLSYPTIE